MRVIGGEFRSRILRSVPGLDVRPTPDRLREALFNVLAPRIEGTVFVDAYAGTGAVGIEALSRGAAKVIFLERTRGALEALRANLSSLQVGARAEVLQGKVTVLLRQVQADIVFLDPPYTQPKEYEAAFDIMTAAPPPLVVAQHASKEKLGEAYGVLQRYRMLRQGDNSLSFYRIRAENADQEGNEALNAVEVNPDRQSP